MISLTLLGVIVVLYFAVRFLLFPTLDWWRPQVENLLSNAIGQETVITGLHGHLDGLSPNIGFNSIRIGSDDHKPPLVAKGLNAEFSARRLLSGDLTPEALTLTGGKVQVKRIGQAEFMVGGVTVTLPPRPSRDASEKMSKVTIAYKGSHRWPIISTSTFATLIFTIPT